MNTREIRRRSKRVEGNAQHVFRKKEGHHIFVPRSNREIVKVSKLFSIIILNFRAETFKRWCKRSECDETTDSERRSETNNNHEVQQQTKERKTDGMKKETEKR